MVKKESKRLNKIAYYGRVPNQTSSIGCSLLTTISYQDLFIKTFNNNKENKYVKSLNIEYKFEEIEELLFESYERIECLKLSQALTKKKDFVITSFI